jgi:uncharacterized protein YsxB (DUF464 family)
VIQISALIAPGHSRIDVTGHEGHVLEGRVCAAVSAIMQAAVLGLEQIALQHPDIASVEIREIE